MVRPKQQFKVCPRCPELRPRSAFYSVRYKKNGKAFTRLSGRCREHEREHVSALQKARVAKGLCRSCILPSVKDSTYCARHREETNTRLRQRNQQIKKQAVEFLGSQCKGCGLVTPFLSVYDFHHRDPSQKDFGIANRRNHDIKALKEELLKCDLLCANCHRIRHETESTPCPE